MNEIRPETMVEWYNLAQYNLKTMQDKMENYKISVWGQISQMPLSDNFIRDFKKKLDWKWISTHQSLNENLIREFQNFIDWRRYLNLKTYLKRLSESFKTK
jgi:hypothetical protein